MTPLSAAVWLGVALLALAVLVGLVRVATATDDASRAVVGDLVFFSAIGMLVLVGMLTGSTVAADAAMIAAILGILATIALSRILTRGRR